MSIARPSKRVFLQVLWTGVDSSIPTLYLDTEKKKYMFNCGEGIERLITERKIRLGKLNTFFFTRYQWSHIGGLIGFGMTLKDIKGDASLGPKLKFTVVNSKNTTGGKGSIQQNDNQVCNIYVHNQQSQTFETQRNVCADKKGTEKKNAGKDESTLHQLSVYGPQGMKKIISATKHFLHFNKTDVNLEVTEHHWLDRLELKGYKDEEINLYSIPIYNNTEKKQPERYSKQDTIKTADLSSMFHPPSLCYVCHLQPLPGKFDVKNAKKLGVPSGPLFAMLQRGETVVLHDGKKVTPQEVIGPEIPGPKFLLIDCPSVPYIESLVQNSHLSKYLSQDEGANLVVHLSPEEVCHDNVYSEWVKRFPSFTKHIYLNRVLQECVAFKSQHSLQIMLNHIDSKIFPLMEEHKTVKEEKDYTDDSLKNFVKINLRELVDKPLNVIDNREVKSEIDHSDLLCRVNKALNKQKEDDAININGKRYHPGEDLDSIQNKKVYMDDGSKSIANNSKPAYSSQIYPKIICLGTGASFPSKYRNVSGTLILLSENDAVLLDCGEGTYCELFRHYGDNVEEILSKIKFIFVSHMHGDHHLGLITLITKLNALQKQPNDSFVIMAPNLLFDWLTKYAFISESLKFKFISCKDAYQGIFILENIHVQPVKVYHPGIAHGVVLIYSNELKITYSGDTMPCNALIDAGKNSKLLIHEATLEDGMIEEARESKHSTITQAIEVAQKMNAEFIILTHFSQRYPRTPVLRNTLLACQTAYAFDHMELTLNDIPKFCDLVPALNALFSQEQENDI